MCNFEKLDVWQKGIDFAELIYDETRAFPVEERFGLSNQLRRASISTSRPVLGLAATGDYRISRRSCKSRRCRAVSLGVVHRRLRARQWVRRLVRGQMFGRCSPRHRQSELVRQP